MSIMGSGASSGAGVPFTWKPASRFETGVSSFPVSSDEDDDGDGTEPGVFGSLVPSFATGAFGRRTRKSYGTGPAFNRRFGRSIGTSVARPSGSKPANAVGREVYWGSTGPKTEVRKINGTTLDMPVLAPLDAPPEDKKLILTQTIEAIAEASSGDWASKTQTLARRFAGSVPNALNEAKVRLSKFKDFTSSVYSYGPPVGYQADMTRVELDNPLMLRFIGFELRIHPQNAPPPTSPVEDLPEQECIQALLKVPLNAAQTDLHEVCTPERLLNVETLVNEMKGLSLPVIFGKLGLGRAFDPAAFKKEWKNIRGVCMFKAVKMVLTRDYVGKGVAKDIYKRLRDCRQMVFQNGKLRMKPVAEQHADFMRLVQEFDAEERIPVSLANIAFHNLARDIQQELVNNKYEPPTTCVDNEEQYRHLAELKTKMEEAEKQLKQWTSIIKRTVGPKGSAPTATFLTTPLNDMEEDMWEQQPEVNNNRSQEQGFLEDYQTDDRVHNLYHEAVHFRSMLSVAEKAMRQASGERAPLECWGCKDIPKYADQRFHRYRSCPNRGDPQVRANFERHLRAWKEKMESDRKRRPSSGASLERYQPRQANRDRATEAHPRTMLTQQNEQGMEESTQDKPQATEGEQKDLMRDFGISSEVNPTRSVAGATLAFKVSVNPWRKYAGVMGQWVKLLFGEPATRARQAEKGRVVTLMARPRTRSASNKASLEIKALTQSDRIEEREEEPEQQALSAKAKEFHQDIIKTAEILTAARILCEIKSSTGGEMLVDNTGKVCEIVRGAGSTGEEVCYRKAVGLTGSQIKDPSQTSQCINRIDNKPVVIVRTNAFGTSDISEQEAPAKSTVYEECPEQLGYQRRLEPTVDGNPVYLVDPVDLIDRYEDSKAPRSWLTEQEPINMGRKAPVRHTRSYKKGYTGSKRIQGGFRGKTHRRAQNNRSDRLLIKEALGSKEAPSLLDRLKLRPRLRKETRRARYATYLAVPRGPEWDRFTSAFDQLLGPPLIELEEMAETPVQEPALELEEALEPDPILSELPILEEPPVSGPPHLWEEDTTLPYEEDFPEDLSFGGPVEIKEGRAPREPEEPLEAGAGRPVSPPSEEEKEATRELPEERPELQGQILRRGSYYSGPDEDYEGYMVMPIVGDTMAFASKEEWNVDGFHEGRARDVTVVTAGEPGAYLRVILVSNKSKKLSFGSLEDHAERGAWGIRFESAQEGELFCDKLWKKDYISAEERTGLWIKLGEFLLPCDEDDIRFVVPAINSLYWETKRQEVREALLGGTMEGEARLIVINLSNAYRVPPMRLPWKTVKLQGRDQEVFKRGARAILADLDAWAGEEEFPPTKLTCLMAKPGPTKRKSDNTGSEGGDRKISREEAQLKAREVLKEVLPQQEGNPNPIGNENQEPSGAMKAQPGGEVIHEHHHEHLHIEEGDQAKPGEGGGGQGKVHRHFHTHVHQTVKPGAGQAKAAWIRQQFSIQEEIRLARHFQEERSRQSMQDRALAETIVRGNRVRKNREVTAQDIMMAIKIRQWVEAKDEAREATYRMYREAGISGREACAKLRMYYAKGEDFVRETYADPANIPPVPADIDPEEWDMVRREWSISEGDHDLAYRIREPKQTLKWKDVIAAMEIRKWGRAQGKVKEAEGALEKIKVSTLAAKDIWNRYKKTPVQMAACYCFSSDAEGNEAYAVKKDGTDERSFVARGKRARESDSESEEDSEDSSDEEDEQEVEERSTGRSAQEEVQALMDMAVEEAKEAHLKDLKYKRVMERDIQTLPVVTAWVMDTGGEPLKLFMLVDPCCTHSMLCWEPIGRASKRDPRYLRLLNRLEDESISMGKRGIDARADLKLDKEVCKIVKVTNPGEQPLEGDLADCHKVQFSLVPNFASANPFHGMLGLDMLRSSDSIIEFGADFRGKPRASIQLAPYKGRKVKKRCVQPAWGDLDNPMQVGPRSGIMDDLMARVATRPLLSWFEPTGQGTARIQTPARVRQSEHKKVPKVGHKVLTRMEIPDIPWNLEGRLSPPPTVATNWGFTPVPASNTLEEALGRATEPLRKPKPKVPALLAAPRGTVKATVPRQVRMRLYTGFEAKRNWVAAGTWIFRAPRGRTVYPTSSFVWNVMKMSLEECSKLDGYNVAFLPTSKYFKMEVSQSQKSELFAGDICVKRVNDEVVFGIEINNETRFCRFINKGEELGTLKLLGPTRPSEKTIPQNEREIIIDLSAFPGKFPVQEVPKGALDIDLAEDHRKELLEEAGVIGAGSSSDTGWKSDAGWMEATERALLSEMGVPVHHCKPCRLEPDVEMKDALVNEDRLDVEETLRNDTTLREEDTPREEDMLKEGDTDRKMAPVVNNRNALENRSNEGNTGRIDSGKATLEDRSHEKDTGKVENVSELTSNPSAALVGYTGKRKKAPVNPANQSTLEPNRRVEKATSALEEGLETLTPEDWLGISLALEEPDIDLETWKALDEPTPRNALEESKLHKTLVKPKTCSNTASWSKLTRMKKAPALEALLEIGEGLEARKEGTNGVPSATEPKAKCEAALSQEQKSSERSHTGAVEERQNTLVEEASKARAESTGVREESMEATPKGPTTLEDGAKCMLMRPVAPAAETGSEQKKETLGFEGRPSKKWIKKWSRFVKRMRRTPRKKQGGGRKGQPALCRSHSFLGWIRALQSHLRKRPYGVPLTERLPHMAFPIGDGGTGHQWKHAPTVKGVFDTGSGLTIGYLPYWSSVANQYPELVEDFGEMTQEEFEELRVGGIEKEGEGATCTHFIALKTPFFNEGKQVILRVALTKSLSCNLIFGLPFIVKAKMTANLWEKFVVSALFQATFPLEYHPPEVREEVLAQDGATVALKANVNNS